MTRDASLLDSCTFERCWCNNLAALFPLCDVIAKRIRNGTLRINRLLNQISIGITLFRLLRQRAELQSSWCSIQQILQCDVIVLSIAFVCFISHAHKLLRKKIYLNQVLNGNEVSNMALKLSEQSYWSFFSPVVSWFRFSWFSLVRVKN